MLVFIVSYATVCFCMFLVDYPQTPEPVIPLVDWHKLTYLVVTCRNTPINQLMLVVSILAWHASVFERVAVVSLVFINQVNVISGDV